MPTAMKIKSIAAICKKSRIAHIYHQAGEDGVQWIGNGMAAYQLLNLPRLDAESLLTIFDVPEKNKEKWCVMELGVPDNIDLSDVAEQEWRVELCGPEIGWQDMTLLPYRTREGIVFIDSKKLTPLADMLEVITLFERRSKRGEVYLAVKAGLLLKAVIRPENVITETLVQELSSLAYQCAAVWERRKLPRLDEETGEVLEE